MNWFQVRGRKSKAPAFQEAEDWGTPNFKIVTIKAGPPAQLGFGQFRVFEKKRHSGEDKECEYSSKVHKRCQVLKEEAPSVGILKYAVPAQ